MRRHLPLLVCLVGLAALLAMAPAAPAQCPSKTTVADTLYNADGSPAAGRLVIAWPTFQIGSCQVVVGQASVTVTNGVLSVALYPNDSAVPAGTSYRATYYLKSGRITTEYWVVPSSAMPVALATVRSASVPVPAVMFGQAQVTNLTADLARKVELPPSCPAGKFLQANGSAGPPQVSCVDGSGAPLASTAVSGTVKTDVNEADPRVYTLASTDALLAGKAAAVHAHAAADTTSGVFDPARLPAPTASTLGGIKSGACSGTDKVTGISTAGTIACAADQAGNSGSQHQVNGSNVAANDPVNFQDSSTIAFANPSAGNITASLKDSSVTAAKLNAVNPTGAQLAGIGDANIAAAALSPNRVAGTAEVLSNKNATGGYPGLDASSRIAKAQGHSATVYADQANTWTTGEQDFTAVAGLRIRTGTGAPASADCDAAGEVGGIYARSDAQAANATLYICSKTGASSYAWELTQGAAGSAFDPNDTTVAWFRDDFLIGSLTTTGNIGQGWAVGSIGSTAVVTSTSDPYPNLGVFQLATAASPAQGDGGLLYTKVTGDLGTNTNWQTDWVAKIEQTTNIRFRAGFGSTVNNSIPTAGIYMRYDTASGIGDSTLQLCVSNSGSETCANTTVSADTNYHRFRIWSVVAGTVRGRMYDSTGAAQGNEVCINSGGTGGCTAGTVPTASMFGRISVCSDAATVQKSIRLDFAAAKWTGMNR